MIYDGVLKRNFFCFFGFSHKRGECRYKTISKLDQIPITNKLSIIINLTETPMAEQSELIVNVLRVCIKFNRAKKFCSSSIPNNVLDKKLPLTTITT